MDRSAVRMDFFAYGTLEFPAVLEAVTGRRFVGTEAVLEGYEREMLAGRSYPAVVPRPGALTRGVLYRALDAEAIALLDRFEDDFYDRRSLAVENGDGRHVSAQVYVLGEAHGALLSGEPWSRTRFAARHLPAYLAQCRRFHAAARAKLASAR